MYRLKLLMNETEMENALTFIGYNIFTDKDNSVDSNLVIELALEQGYTPSLDTETDEILFTFRTIWSIA